jgi:hypothetical protein
LRALGEEKLHGVDQYYPARREKAQQKFAEKRRLTDVEVERSLGAIYVGEGWLREIWKEASREGGALAEGISTVTQAFFRKEYLTLALSTLLLFGSI